VAGWLDGLLFVQGLLLVGLAIFLLARGARGASTVLLAMAIGGPGLIMAAHGGFPLAGGYPPFYFTAFQLTYGTLMCATLAFAIAYPARVLHAKAAWRVAWAFIPIAVTLAALVVATPLVMNADLSPATPMLNVVSFIIPAAYLLGAIALGAKWARAAPGPHKGQFLFVLLAYLFFNIHDGVGILAHATTNLFRDAYPAVPTALTFLYAACVVAGVSVAGVSVRRMLTRPREETREDRFLVLGVVAFIPISVLQILVAVAGHHVNGVTTHLLIDGLILPILGYGVLKYQILDVDLKVKWGIRSGTLAGAGLVILLVVQQLIEQHVGSVFGAVGGAVVAGVALFALTPLQRAAERVSERAMPRVQESAAYLSFRRMEIYRAALEGILRDGTVDRREAAVLAGLREELGLTLADHEALEGDIRRRLAPPVAVAA